MTHPDRVRRHYRPCQVGDAPHAFVETVQGRVLGHAYRGAFVVERVCVDCGRRGTPGGGSSPDGPAPTQDARVLVQAALDRVPREPYDPTGVPARIEAACRRVVRSLDVHLADVVHGHAERPPA